MTGLLLDRGPDELAQAVLEFDDAAVDPDACVRNAARFDVASFRRAMFARGRGRDRARARAAVGDRQPLPTTRLVRRAARDRE